MGMSEAEALASPFGLLQDLIAIGQIESGDYERVLSENEEAEDLAFLASYR